MHGGQRGTESNLWLFKLFFHCRFFSPFSIVVIPIHSSVCLVVCSSLLLQVAIESIRADGETINSTHEHRIKMCVFTFAGEFRPMFRVQLISILPPGQASDRYDSHNVEQVNQMRCTTFIPRLFRS